MYQVRLTKTFGVMIRFDNVLLANVSGILQPKSKIRGVPMGRCRVDTCFTFVRFIKAAFFFFLVILTFY